MPFDFNTHLSAVTRSVTALERDGKPVRAVTLERAYETTLDDLWDAVTNPERLPRWFLPVSGELRLGGHYQFEGNAGGTITHCERPTFVAATWEFGGGMSWVEVRLSADGDARSRLRLSHICPVDDFWNQFGPGAVGVGWDLGLVALAPHLAAPRAEREPFDENAFAMSEEGRAIIAGVSEDWGRAAIAAGEDPVQTRAAVRQTTAFYTGQEPPEE